MIMPVLQAIQVDIAFAKTDVAILKENTRRLEEKMTSVELHLLGFMSTVHTLETENETLRSRLKDLEVPPAK